MSIVHKAKGLLVPQPYWLKALKDATAVGYALKDGNTVSVACSSSTGEKFIEELEAIQTEFKDQDIIFTLMPGKLSEDDIQPFTMLKDAKDDWHLVGFAEGKFRNFVPSGESAHTNEYFMFNKYLIPKIKKLFEGAALSSIPNLMNELNDPILRDELSNIGTDSTIVMFASNGQYAWMGNAPLYRKYTWGATNDHLDYEETAAVAAAAEPTRSTWKDRKAAKLIATAIGDGKAPIIASVEPIKQPDKPLVTDPKPTETKIPQDVATEYEMLSPPQEIRNSNKAVKNWYQNTNLQRNGYKKLPDNWREYPAIQVKKLKQQPLKSFQELKNTDLAKAQPSVVAKFVRIINPKVLEALTAEFKNLDKSSQDVIDPNVLEEFEKASSSFWEQTLISKDVTDAWADETVLQLCIKYPIAAAVLFLNYRANEIILSMKAEKEEEYEAPDNVDTSGTGTIADTPRKSWKERKAAKLAASA